MKISFTDNRIGQGDIPKMRGYISHTFPQYTELHHHLEGDKLLYQYPHIQYKVLSNIPMVIGIDSGVEVLKSIYDKIDEFKIGCEIQIIFEKQIIVRNEEFVVSDKTKGYTFLTPWLALNQENYNKWNTLSNHEKQERLNRILIGNILSMAKGLRYVVTEEIKAEMDVRPVLTKLKGVPMVGFLGRFCVNFAIPDYLGLGKSVSRGFGTIKKGSFVFRLQS